MRGEKKKKKKQLEFKPIGLETSIIFFLMCNFQLPKKS